MNDIAHKSTNTFYVDTYYGNKGGGAWLAVFGWLGTAYGIYIFYNSAMSMVSRGDTGLAALFFFCLFTVYFC